MLGGKNAIVKDLWRVSFRNGRAYTFIFITYFSNLFIKDIYFSDCIGPLLIINRDASNLVNRNKSDF